MYFLFNLIFNIIFMLFVLFIIIFTINQIREKMLKKVYYTLVIIMILVIPGLVQINLPKIKDVKNLLNKNYATYEGRCERIKDYKGMHNININNRTFSYNPWSFKPVINKKYIVYYLANSKYVIKYIEK